MKYALIVHEEKPKAERTQENVQHIVNLGNYVQWIAIEKLYSYVGIDEKDIIRLSSEELRTYNGEQMILPINYIMFDTDMCAYTTRDKRFVFSDCITPLFLGFSVKNGYWEWTEERIEYFKKYEPIGCRDYLTWKTMVDLGIKAYLSGCITWTLPLHKNRKAGNTTYFVEAPKALEKYIPLELKKNCKCISQEIEITEEEFYDYSYGYRLTKELLEEYDRNAKLVVTSRLHCASPCMAMGIPVILAKEYYGHPYDLLKKFLPMYSYKNLEQIDWNPGTVDMESYKRIALDCAKKRLLGENADEQIHKLHEEFVMLYSNGYEEEKMDLNFLFQKLDSRYDKNAKFNYAIWGISKDAEKIYEYINIHYPKAKLVKVIDSFRKQDFHGVMSQTPDILKAQDDFLVIVATLNCCAAARSLFKHLGKQEEKYICVTDGIIDNMF